MIRYLKKLLVIDDHEADLRVVARSFMAAAPGIEIETLKGSETAVDRIVSGDSDIVLMDINMPGLNGLEVLESARNRTNATLPVVIMLSTSEDPTDLKAAYDSGASAYVVKPDTMADFENLARSIQGFWGAMVSRPV
ncbi:MAG: response regulator [Pseudomonadota bacterium]